MDDKTKLSIQSKLIKELKEENEILHRANDSLMDKIETDQELVANATNAIQVYKEHMMQLETLRKANEDILKQFKNLRNAYKKEMKNIME